jgi:hypothetical protein
MAKKGITLLFDLMNEFSLDFIFTFIGKMWAEL